ncbi:LacI family DNA-binding transcriptional regulator [Priestia megaterium]|uniref:Helix-turn-helix family protein n=1 Tax=Priestia megaterium (strain ATCC 14581 / DSM 32 / CCUG 1817 / JCM 2506 / NBRC 15308 / NCIMB 9376 / NCTC 10342 / NRRL B-14308 / VKM B-512 / Ford 19) TaxID=1348623 RepID=A0A0B6A701_PRIM2|nr:MULTISPECIES: LacI family DNA-binding transcriptional regulator [Priestia]AJI20735.1 helix-turn-helix family protein [Priestia megaterium NBRC 15308 = ATCC 14581]KFN06084.1 helix-turn-helix family protein [Priestia megaterium]KGJ82602.1 LacI family transcriptional regulator [Priestia megaterium NBRC 15308 = ATCC 14581]MBU8753309.1 LacI family transcriptional regulator [Priestia megaterium]MCU7707810.1 LacI family transcriptional regulator [Priestia megaterium]
MTTIKDIARVAGVSVTTVSRALNGYSDVNEKTRQKIAAVAKELNYSPNTLARGLVMQKSKTIGLLVSGISRESVKDNFTFEVLCGVNERASTLGYDLILFNTNTMMQREKTYTQLCRERRVDGAIIQGIKKEDPYLKEVVESDIPCVLVDIPVHSNSVGYVTTDNALGAKKAVEHLASLGHQHIGMINGHEDAFVSQERLNGYREALKECGLSFHSEWVVSGNFEEKKAEKAARELINRHKEVTAIFCASDLMALGALKACKELGLQVPKDISIVGYDNIVLASYSSPNLTTVGQEVYQIGYQAADLLIEMLEGKETNMKRYLDTKLIIRESTAKNHN